MALVLFREAMQTAVLLHLTPDLAAFKLNQLHASLDLFSELYKEPFILQQGRKPCHAPPGGSQLQQLPLESYPRSQGTAWFCPQPLAQSQHEQLQLLLQALPAASLPRFGVFDFTLKSTCLAAVQAGRACLLFVLGQAEHGAGHLPRFPSELRCRAVSWGTLGPS